MEMPPLHCIVGIGAQELRNACSLDTAMAVSSKLSFVFDSADSRLVLQKANLAW